MEIDFFQRSFQINNQPQKNEVYVNINNQNKDNKCQ